MTTTKATKPSQSVHYGVVVGYDSQSSTVSEIAHDCLIKPTGKMRNGEAMNELQMGAYNAFGKEGDQGRLWGPAMALVQQFAERVMQAFIREAISNWDGEALPDGFEGHLTEATKLKFGKPLSDEQQADKDEIAALKAQIAALQNAAQITSDPNAK